MKKKITINDELHEIPSDFKGIHLLSILPNIIGESFRKYRLVRINVDGDVDLIVKNNTTIETGDKFWAIPPCYS